MNYQKNLEKLKTRRAEELVEGLGQAMGALSFFNTERNPLHLMVNTDTGETLGLVIQGKENVDKALPVIEKLCDELMPQGKRVDYPGGAS